MVETPANAALGPVGSEEVTRQTQDGETARKVHSRAGLEKGSPSDGDRLYHPSDAESETDEAVERKRQKTDVAPRTEAAGVNGVGSAQVNDGSKHVHCGRGPPPGQIGTVVVWDLDETLIVFNSLLTSSFPGSADGEVDSAAMLRFAEQIETLLYAVAEDSFFFNSLEGRNRWHLAEAASFDDGRPVEHYPFAMDGLKGLLSEGGASGKESEDDKRLAALRYRVARQRYERARSSDAAICEVIGKERAEAAQAAVEAIDALSSGWLSTASETLASVWQLDSIVLGLVAHEPPAATPPKPGAASSVFCPPDERRGDAAVRSTGPHTHVHVLVTNGELIPTLCKLLLFGLHPFFHPDNVFSSREVGKHACFAEVARRFGSARRIIALGDSKEEEGAARTANFDFVRVSGPADVRAVLDMLAA